MKASLLLLVCPLLVLGLCGWMSLGRDATTVTPLPAPTTEAPASPPELDAALAEEYAPLAFQEFYVTPVGPRGLEYSAKTQQLAGRRVKLTGHMVRHYHDDPRLFLFTAIPTTHDQREYMLADSLPVSLVHVIMEVRPGQAPDWRPRAITVYGVLETGPHQEIDGRISNLRLRADHVTEGGGRSLIELRRPVVLQRGRMRAGPAPVIAERQPHLPARPAATYPQDKPSPTPSSP